MHPALSIVFFTVVTGLAYGWIALAIVLSLAGTASWHHEQAFTWTAVAAIALMVAGLASSTFHLANPRNAWRAVMRVRTSWLSREAALALAFFPVYLAYVGTMLAGGGRLTAVLGWLSAAIALATVFSTGMIYACLRTIRHWHTPLVPANYLLMALALGGVALHLQRELTSPGGGSGVEVVVFGLLVLALAGKVVYWLEVGLPESATISTATGFRVATVRLLDTGHTAGNFLTREFGYTVSRPMVVLLRVAAALLGFVLPALLVARGHGAVVSWAALVSGVAGALIERWLFFAEAQHVVRLYHGQAQT